GEIGRFAALERAVMARVVAGLRHLDLDHPGAQLGQQQCAIRPGENPRQIDDRNAGKRSSLWHASKFLLVRWRGHSAMQVATAIGVGRKSAAYSAEADRN